MYSFDLLGNAWKKRQSMIRPRSFHSSCFSGKRLFVFGGCQENTSSDEFDAEFLNTETKNDWVAIKILVETPLDF